MLRVAQKHSKAQYLIESGYVRVNGQIINKPSKKFALEDKIMLTNNIKYVSRAGYKLEEFMRECKIDVEW